MMDDYTWMISESELGFVKEQWFMTCLPIISDRDLVSDWWTKLFERYTESHRHYHTLKHIFFMLNYLTLFRCEGNITKPTQVILAIFFHDFIYDVKSVTNEKNSADMFKSFAAEAKLKDSDTEFVYHLIILTESHKTPHHSFNHEFGVDDEHYLLDLDMAILGQPWKVYKAYAHAVRQEYIHVPHDQYCEKRAKVLSGFAESSRIYCTEKFNAEFEAIAKHNTEKEVGLLMQNDIP